jgi:hypothetical protein
MEEDQFPIRNFENTTIPSTSRQATSFYKATLLLQKGWPYKKEIIVLGENCKSS